MQGGRLWNLSSIPWRIYCLKRDIIMIESILFSLTWAGHSRDGATSLDLCRISSCILKIIVTAHEIGNAWVITIIVRRSVPNRKGICA